MQKYVNEQYRLKLEFPENWELFESQEMGGMQILPPASEEGDSIKTGKLSILIRPKGDISTEDAGVLNYIASEIVRTNFTNYDSCVLHSLRHGAVGSRPSREIIFSYMDTKNQEHMQALQVITVAGNSLYLLTYTAAVGRFSENLHPVAEIMASVSFF